MAELLSQAGLRWLFGKERLFEALSVFPPADALLQTYRGFMLAPPEVIVGQKRYCRISKALGLRTMEAGHVIDDTFRQCCYWCDHCRYAQGLGLGQRQAEGFGLVSKIKHNPRIPHRIDELEPANRRMNTH